MEETDKRLKEHREKEKERKHRGRAGDRDERNKEEEKEKRNRPKQTKKKKSQAKSGPTQDLLKGLICYLGHSGDKTPSAGTSAQLFVFLCPASKGEKERGRRSDEKGRERERI